MNKYVTKLKSHLKNEPLGFLTSGGEAGSLRLEEGSIYLSLENKLKMKVKDFVPSKGYNAYDVIGVGSELKGVTFKLGTIGRLDQLKDLPILLANNGLPKLIIEGDDVYCTLVTTLFGEKLARKELYCSLSDLDIRGIEVFHSEKIELTYMNEIYLYLGWDEK